jgi:hypothetical protein
VKKVVTAEWWDSVGHSGSVDVTKDSSGRTVKVRRCGISVSTSDLNTVSGGPVFSADFRTV